MALHPIHQNIAVSGGGDDKSYLWRLYDGEQLYEFGGHTDSVTQVAFSVDGTYVASGSMDGKVRVWKSETGEFMCELEGPDEVVVSPFSSTSGSMKRIAAAHTFFFSCLQTSSCSGSTGIPRATSFWLALPIPRFGCGLSPQARS